MKHGYNQLLLKEFKPEQEALLKTGAVHCSLLLSA